MAAGVNPRRWQAGTSGTEPGGVRRIATRVLVVLALVQAAWLAYPHLRRIALQTEETSAARGQQVAHELGCFACHGPGGGGGVPNPGSEEGEVPSLDQQTQMMYAPKPADLREYILDGAPKKRREDPDYIAKMEGAALRMPAYRGVISNAQLDSLVDYLRAVSGLVTPDDEKAAARGLTVAQELGCFDCHGPMGAGGVSNPRSFKGYIPGFWGPDYAELVQSDDELRRWIAEGKISRIAEHPIGKWFFRRQLIKMPAYGRFRSPEDIEALMAYVKWVHEGRWRPLSH